MARGLIRFGTIAAHVITGMPTQSMRCATAVDTSPTAASAETTVDANPTLGDLMPDRYELVITASGVVTEGPPPDPDPAPEPADAVKEDDR